MTVARHIPPATVTYTIDFRRQVKKAEPRGRVPRVTRLLALAHKIDGMIRAGEIQDLADAARLAGLSRARVSQIMNLLLLAPAIQEAILDLPRIQRGRDPISERDLRPVTAERLWTRQFALWKPLMAQCPAKEYN